MSDALEEQLASHLRALGDTVDDELPPPGDLEVQVLRRRRRARATRRWSGLSVAAAILIVGIVAATVHGTGGRGVIRITTSSSTVVQLHDPFVAGTTMLSARGHYVISLNARGHTTATMAGPVRGDITYARATADHRQIWYLSRLHGASTCGDVVREDVDEGTSTIVTQAVAFDVSPDGSRLALYGAGDLATGHCAPVKSNGNGRLVVLDPASHASSAVAMRNLTGLSWSPDGSYIVAMSCAGECLPFQRIDVPTTLGRPLVVRLTGPELYPVRLIRSASVAFGPDGLYTLEASVPVQGAAATRPTDQVQRVKAGTFDFAVPIFSGANEWTISQVVPTTAGTYVVATRVQRKGTPGAPATGLYLVRAGRLVLMRGLTEPGTLTPVPALRAAG